MATFGVLINFTDEARQNIGDTSGLIWPDRASRQWVASGKHGT
jgi:hypothetical protein